MSDTIVTGEVPALQVMPVLDADVRAALRDSITRFGVLVPIAVTPEGQIIDGHNRWDIAQELGVPCEQKVYPVSTPEQALELAETLNMDRRHLDRDTRATLAVSLREQGHSLRAIAGALGVGKSTVADDLATEDGDLQLSDDRTAATEDGDDEGTATPSDARPVTGLDGKSYPATRRGPWSRDELLELLTGFEEASEAGTAQSDYADQLGMSLSNLQHVLTKARKVRKGETPMEKLERVSVEIRRQQIEELAATGLTTRQIAKSLELSETRVRTICSEQGIDIPADAVVGKTRRIDSNRIVEETVIGLDGSVMALGMVEVADLDAAQIDGWVTSLGESLKVLTRFRNQLRNQQKEITQ